MSITDDRIKYLLTQYADNNATESEVSELFAIVKQPEYNDFFNQWLGEKLEKTESTIMYDQERWDKMAEKILNERRTPGYQQHDKPLVRMKWRRWAVAVSIILALGVGGYFLFFDKSGKQSEK